MRFSIAPGIAVLALASSALAQIGPPRRADMGDGMPRAEDTADGPGNGLQLEVNVFRLTGTYTTDGIFTGSAGIVGSGLISTLQPLALVGYEFDQNAILLGIGVASVGVPGSATGAGVGASEIFFGISPTYRRYLSPLRTGRISTFGEGGLTFSIASPSGTGAPPATWAIGADIGGGAEWLFVRNIALFAKVLLAYGHVNQPVNGGVTGTTSNINYDALGLVGDVGLTVHF
jgi:hypothetical protein